MLKCSGIYRSVPWNNDNREAIKILYVSQCVTVDPHLLLSLFLAPLSWRDKKAFSISFSVWFHSIPYLVRKLHSK